MSNVSLVNGHIDRPKMTDEEIIKALECCFTGAFDKCEECPLNSEYDELFSCLSIKQKLVADLINRQKAEIERLNKRIAGQKHSLFEQQSYTAELQNELKTIKSEVVKEFAERLKCNTSILFDKVTGLPCSYTISNYDFNRLVKEMTGNPSVSLRQLPLHKGANKGKWLINPDGYYPYCSECKEEPEGRKMTKFCPECGADMRGEKNEQI